MRTWRRVLGQARGGGEGGMGWGGVAMRQPRSVLMAYAWLGHVRVCVCARVCVSQRVFMFMLVYTSVCIVVFVVSRI